MPAEPARISRRRLLALASAVLPLGCVQQTDAGGGSSDGHVTTRPKAPTMKIEPGEHALGVSDDSSRDGLLIVPRGYTPETRAPLVVLMHGAGGRARRVANLFAVADELGVIVLAPQSRDATWDGIRGRFGPDLAALDRALAYTFERCAVDTRRLAIGGFSDGATYGLSVGLASGDLFTHVLACSPGFIIPGAVHGQPRIFISHGTADEILPINATSRRIVPNLEKAGYVVKYREFDGPHAVPPAIAREALEWFLGR